MGVNRERPGCQLVCACAVHPERSIPRNVVNGVCQDQSLDGNFFHVNLGSQVVVSLDLRRWNRWRNKGASFSLSVFGFQCQISQASPSGRGKHLPASYNGFRLKTHLRTLCCFPQSFILNLSIYVTHFYTDPLMRM